MNEEWAVIYGIWTFDETSYVYKRTTARMDEEDMDGKIGWCDRSTYMSLSDRTRKNRK